LDSSRGLSKGGTKAFEFFKGKGSAADAKTELFRPGEAMALVYSKSEKSREEGEWKVHAVAIVLMLQDPFDRSEIAGDDGRCVIAQKRA
jgi:hypothetical protein